MNETESGLLVRLRDTGETIADPKQDLRGRIVKSANGEEIGKVTALIIDDRERRVRVLQVEIKGFLGIAKRTTFVPVELIRGIASTTVRIDRTDAHVASAPTYDPVFIDGLALFARTYGHYELEPYWSQSPGSRPQSGASKHGEDDAEDDRARGSVPLASPSPGVHPR